MAVWLIVGGLGAVLFVTAWYIWSVCRNRRRATEVLQWIRLAFQGHGETGSVEWMSSSCFQVHMVLFPGVFHNGLLVVQLLPRQTPVSWLLNRARHRAETLTFQADLDVAPGFNLEVHNHRWYGRTRRRFPGKSSNWTLEQAGPFVMTTRNDWQREVTTMMNALVASRECDCSSVSFRRSSPHFAVTTPLETISPDSETQAEVFNVFRELAGGASTTRF